MLEQDLQLPRLPQALDSVLEQLLLLLHLLHLQLPLRLELSLQDNHLHLLLLLLALSALAVLKVETVSRWKIITTEVALDSVLLEVSELLLRSVELHQLQVALVGPPLPLLAQQHLVALVVALVPNLHLAVVVVRLVGLVRLNHHLPLVPLHSSNHSVVEALALVHLNSNNPLPLVHLNLPRVK